MRPEQFGVEFVHRSDGRVSCVFPSGDNALIMPVYVVHIYQACVEVSFESAECLPLFCKRLAVQPYDDLAFRLDQKPFAKECDAVLRCRYSAFVRHLEAEACEAALYDFLCSFHDILIVAEHQKVVIVADIEPAERLELMVERIEQGDLMKLIDLAAEACASFAERISFDLLSRPLVS